MFAPVIAWLVARNLLKPAIYALAVLAAIAIGVSSYYGFKAYERHEGKIEQQRLDELQKLKDSNATLTAQVGDANKQIAKQIKAAQDLTNELDQQQQANAKLAKDLKNEVRANPVYRTCRVPVNGLRLYNAARTGSGTGATAR